LAALTRTSALAPWKFTGAAAVLAAVSLLLASGLTIRSSLQELLPADMPSVKRILDLQRRVGGDGNVLVNVEALDGPPGLAKAEVMAPVLARDFLAMGPADVRAVEWEQASMRDWFAAHWPLFATVQELTEARDAVRAEIRRRTAESNPLAVPLEQEEEEAPAKLADIIDPDKPTPREKVAQHFEAYRDGFMVHPDGCSLTILVRPTGTALSVVEARALLARMRALVDKRAPELRAAHLRVGFAGSFPLYVAEYESVVADVGLSALVTGIVVLVSLLVFFQDVRSTLTLGLCVGLAVAVNFGLTRLTIGFLNRQTAFLGSIVAGNGLNYGVIYLARVRQLRRKGTPLCDACVEAARTTAAATFLASLATSVSFATLVVAANRGFRHFGIIGGVGMVLCWIATFTLAPALLALFEKVRPVLPLSEGHAVTRRTALAERVFARPGPLLAGYSLLVLTAGGLCAARAPVAMEHNLENLGNQLRGFEELQRDHERAQASLGRSISGAMALLDSREDAERFCDAVRARMRQAPWSQVIQGCNTIASVVPERQPEKLALLGEIRAELTDARLSHLQPRQRERMRGIRTDLVAQHSLADADAPPALLDGFRERDGSLGRLAVVTARPDAKLELAPRLEAFAAGVRNVPVSHGTADATGENVVFADLLSDVESEGPRTTLLSFAGVCLVILLVLRQGMLSLHVIAVMAAGVLLMAGIAAAADLKINFFNFIAFPITFGISSDYGANIATRVRARGGLVLASLVEVGPAVAMCSWTTVVGYASLLFSLNRALRSFGWYAIVGEVTTLSSALIMLPAMLLIEQRRARRLLDRVSREATS